MAKRQDGFNPKVAVGRTKAPLRLVPPALLIGVATVQELGAARYGAYNWRAFKVSRVAYLEAALRHILLALDGEDADPESGEWHEAHVAAGMGIVLDARAVGCLVDDRFKTGKVAALLAGARDRCAEIRARHPGKAKSKRRKR